MDELKEDLHLGDALLLMPKIEIGTVDLILTDLPYGVTARNSWDVILPFDKLWSEWKRLLKPNGAVVLTATQPFASMTVMSNIPWFKYEWIWKKSKVTGVLNAKKQPLRQHEQVLVFYDKQPTYNPQGLVPLNKMVKQGSSSSNYGRRGSQDVFQENTNYPRSVLEIASEGGTVHPTQKPVALMEYLIRTYTNEGDLVLDCCMGSGTTGVACAIARRRFIGMEMNAKYFQIATGRIEGEAPNLDAARSMPLF